MSFFGDDHGREAVVGRRDAYWASGGSDGTNSLLLSAVWVVGAVFADRNALALGGSQQGVSNLTSELVNDYSSSSDFDRHAKLQSRISFLRSIEKTHRTQGLRP